MNKANPNIGNVAQFPGADLPEEHHIRESKNIRPLNLSKKEIAVWDLIAVELSKIGRLKKIYIEVIAEYCRVVVRMSETRAKLDDEGWTYETNGRHGKQSKSRPDVAQLNDDWRKFKSLVGDLGLSPSAEKSLNAAQGDLFGSNDFNKF